MIKISEINGVILPLPNYLIKRFFEDNKSVFIKSSHLKKLKNGQKLIIYSSGQNRGLFCETEIENIENLKSNQIWEKYSDKIVLNKDEFDLFVSKSVIYVTENRKNKDFLVLTLKNFLKYKKPIKINFRMTVAGCYLTPEMYSKISNLI